VEESKGKEGNAISQLKYAIEKMKEKDKKISVVARKKGSGSTPQHRHRKNYE